MPFNLNSKQLFLTYPECDISKEKALELIQNIIHTKHCTVELYIVAQEKHQNGHDHLHCYFKLHQTLRTSSATLFDLIHPDTLSTYHGNYQGCRSAKNVTQYCTKKDNYLSNFDVSEYLNTKSNRKQIAEDIVIKKTKLEDLVQDHPTLIFGYQRLKNDILTFQEDTAPTKADLPAFLPNPWARVLPSFRNAKKRHYWIYSRQPNLGKTFLFARPLSEDYRCVIATGDFTYWNVDRHTQCVILDDYNYAKLKWGDLNQLADGTFQFRVIYRGVVTLRRYLVIILSNSSIRDIYPNKYEFIEARFIEKELI